MTTTSLLRRFRTTIMSNRSLAPTDPALLIERSGTLSCHYAPFDHINPHARVVLLGMTPGTQQARKALDALRDALATGHSESNALAIAKATASFSGQMRTSLVALLDSIGLQGKLGIASCSELFGDRTDLVHFTSALRYPVFLDGKDYQGAPSILSTSLLRQMSELWLVEEVRQLNNAWWIALGKEARAVLLTLADAGLIPRERCLDGLPHPSGTNSERIAYFLGKKSRDALSVKTNADDLDERRRILLRKLGTVSQVASPPAVQTNTDSFPPRDVPTSKGRRATSDRLARTFVLRGYRGEHIYPIRYGDGAFRLSRRGAQMHRSENAIHVTDEAKAYQMVASGTYKIRTVRDGVKSPSLLGLGDRVVASVEKIAGMPL